MSTDDDGGEASREVRGREIRAKLKAAREERGMSQQDVAAALGVSRQSVSLWELYQTHPGVDQLADWCRAVGRKLRVQVVDPADAREPLYVRRESAEFVHRFERLSAEDRAVVMALLRRFE